jgi:hypothetical protein
VLDAAWPLELGDDAALVRLRYELLEVAVGIEAIGQA